MKVFFLLLLLIPFSCGQWALPEVAGGGGGEEKKGIQTEPTAKELPASGGGGDAQAQDAQVDPPPSLPEMPRPKWVEEDMDQIRDVMMKEIEKVTMAIEKVLTVSHTKALKDVLPHLDMIKQVYEYNIWGTVHCCNA